MNEKPRLDKIARQQIILGEARRSAALRISDLARYLEVSGETIRRDLDELGNAGRLRRIYGGATLPARSAEGLASRGGKQSTAALLRMAGVVAAQVEPGQTVMIGGGPPAQHVARLLARSVHDIVVITNNLGIAAVAGSGTAQIVLCPGTYDAEDDSVLGEDTIEYLARFTPDLTVIASHSLSPSGASDDRRGSANVKRAMLRSGRRAVLVIGHRHLGRNALQQIAPLHAFTEVVTSGKPPAEMAAACRSAGVKLTAA
ncbi:MAG: DeoR/GlpR family DNA-binding transcription regulator [Kiloniellaceae bacterium]